MRYLCTLNLAEERAIECPRAPSPHLPPVSQVAWEARKYQLRLGYGAVPKFVAVFKEGLGEKLQKIQDARRRLDWAKDAQPKLTGPN